MDGLVAACKAALNGGTAPERHGAAPHITVLVKDETLAQAAGASTETPPDQAPPGARPTPAPPGLIPGPAPAQTGHGTLLTARQVLGLCCGAQINAIRWADGLPLGVGRTPAPNLPACGGRWKPATGGCRWTECGALAAWATAHHIRPWSKGGATSLARLALFCFVHHHHFIHTLGWIITGNPNGTLYFTHPGGWVTLESPLPGR